MEYAIALLASWVHFSSGVFFNMAVKTASTIVKSASADWNLVHRQPLIFGLFPRLETRIFSVDDALVGEGRLCKQLLVARCSEFIRHAPKLKCTRDVDFFAIQSAI